MAEDREIQGGTTESTERIPPGSMPPDDPKGAEEEPADDEEKADEESKQSFPASDPPAW
jgi:hypothetical protein